MGYKKTILFDHNYDSIYFLKLYEKDLEDKNYKHFLKSDRIIT